MKTSMYNIIVTVRDYPGEPVSERQNQLGFTGARDSEWQWHELGHMQICTSPQAENLASISPLIFFTGHMPFLLPNQQEGHPACKKLSGGMPYFYFWFIGPTKVESVSHVSVYMVIISTKFESDITIHITQQVTVFLLLIRYVTLTYDNE